MCLNRASRQQAPTWAQSVGAREPALHVARSLAAPAARPRLPVGRPAATGSGGAMLPTARALEACARVLARKTSSSVGSCSAQVRDGDIGDSRSRAHDVGELLGTLAQADGDRARRALSADLLAERKPSAALVAAQSALVTRESPSTVGRETGGLQRRRGSLGDDLCPAVDDPDAVGENVGLLEVLASSGRTVVPILAGPGRATSSQSAVRELDVEAGRRPRRGTGWRGLCRKREGARVEAGASCRRSRWADLRIGGVGEAERAPVARRRAWARPPRAAIGPAGPPAGACGSRPVSIGSRRDVLQRRTADLRRPRTAAPLGGSPRRARPRCADPADGGSSVVRTLTVVDFAGAVRAQETRRSRHPRRSDRSRSTARMPPLKLPQPGSDTWMLRSSFMAATLGQMF